MVRPINGGFFITLEGGEGAGKSTQARCLAEALRHDGVDVCLTREPGGTPGAEALRRQLLFGEEAFSWKAEIMLHMTARCDHIDHYIQPALERGAVVICDRFHDSTWAYQGYGVGEGNPERLAFIQSLRTLMAYEPQKTFWLDLPLDVAHRRVVARQGEGDRYEGQAMPFHQRVAEGFRDLYQQDPHRITRVDAERSLEEISHTLYRHVWATLRENGL